MLITVLTLIASYQYFKSLSCCKAQTALKKPQHLSARCHGCFSCKSTRRFHSFHSQAFSWQRSLIASAFLLRGADTNSENTPASPQKTFTEQLLSNKLNSIKYLSLKGFLMSSVCVFEGVEQGNSIKALQFFSLCTTKLISPPVAFPQPVSTLFVQHLRPSDRLHVGNADLQSAPSSCGCGQCR